MKQIMQKKFKYPISICHNSLKPIKINEDEFIFVNCTIGKDYISGVNVISNIQITKYNIINSKWHQQRIILNKNVNLHHGTNLKIHDIVHFQNNLYIIDSIGQLTVIEDFNRNNDTKVKIRQLQSQYNIKDNNDPKLAIIDKKKLYVLAPDCHDGRYLIDISNDKYSIQRLGL